MNSTGHKNASPAAFAPPPSSAQEPIIDIWQYLRIIRSRALLVVLTVLTVVGFTAYVTLRAPKVYRAVTTIRIESRAPQVLGRDVEDVVEMGSGSYWHGLEYLETQYRIIASRDVATRVVRKLNLQDDALFMEGAEQELAFFEGSKEEFAAKRLQRFTSVQPVQDSRLAEIRVENNDPQRAQLYANTIASAYVDRNLEMMLKSTLDAGDWLAKQLDDAQDKLTAAEQALFDYKEDKDILSVSLEDRQNILTAQMTAAATRLTEAHSLTIELGAEKEAISKVAKQKNPLKISLDALNRNLLIQRLKQRYAELSQKYGELSSRYGPKFPKMIEIKAKMKQIEQDIDREVKNVLRAVDAELAAAKTTEKGLKKALEELRQRGHALGKNEVHYNRLAREKDTNEKVYQLLLGRSKEADLSKLLRVNNVQILDPAVRPSHPIKPRVRLNLFLSLIFGTILGIALAFLVEFMDRNIKTQADAEALGIPFLGIVPSVGSYGMLATGTKTRQKASRRKTDRRKKSTSSYDTYVHDYPKSQISEAYRSVRTNILFMSADKPVKSLLITSPSPQEGKTTVTCNLAIAMAQSGSKTLLIDTDMRRPRLHKTFQQERPERGLSTLILGESNFQDTLVSTHIPNLFLLPCGPIPPNPAELLHTESFSQVVAGLSERFDRLIFDSPPVAIVTDAAILSKIVDGTVLVLRSQQTTRDSSRHALGKLRDIEAKVMGTVLNNLDLTNRKYSSNFYDYYQQYGYHYIDDQDSAQDLKT